MYCRSLILTGLLVVSLWAMAQNEEKLSLELEGMAAVSYGENSVGINIGGPHLQMKVGQKLKIGVGAFPSLFIGEETTEPKLGLGPRLDWGKWVFIAPLYHFNNPDRWVNTYGIGRKF